MRQFKLISVLVALVGVSLATIYGSSEWVGTCGVVLITIAFCAYVGLTRFYTLQPNEIPNFLIIFLIFQILNKALTLTSLVVLGLGWELGDLREAIVDNVYRWRAEWVFLIGTVCFWLGWDLTVSKVRAKFPRILPTKKLFLVFGISMVAFLVTGPLLQLSFLGGIVALFRSFALGVTAVLLYVDGPYSLGERRSVVPLLMLIPLGWISLSSGMKSEAIFVLFPVILSALRRISVGRAVVLAGLLLVFVVYVIPLTQSVRQVVWFGGEEMSLNETSELVSKRWEREGVAETALDSAVNLANRASSAEIGGLVMYIAERDGHIWFTPLKGALGIFIPRFLWPDKPQYAPGAWFTWYLGRAESPETATTATATMLGTELYWMFGWAGVVIGMFGLGSLNAAAWNLLAERAPSSPWVLSALLAFLIGAIRLEEIALIYCISGTIIYVCYVKSVGWLETAVTPNSRRRI